MSRPTLKMALSLATPLVIGSFLLSAVTGILMFFHLDMGLNKFAHEWLSWVLVVGVGLHVLNHLVGFKRYFRRATAQWLIGSLAALLLLSFVPWGAQGGGPAPHVVVLRRAAEAPVPALALLAGVPVSEMRQRLRDAGLDYRDDGQSVKSLVGPDRQRQVQVLGRVLALPAS